MVDIARNVLLGALWAVVVVEFIFLAGRIPRLGLEQHLRFMYFLITVTVVLGIATVHYNQKQ